MDRVSLIKRCPPFRDLDSNAVKELADAAQKEMCEKGSVLFSEGEEANALYLLVSGSIDLIKSTMEGKEQLVRSVRDGEVFAEAVMFAGETYPVTAIAKMKSEYLMVTKDRFVQLVAAHPEISMTIIGTMAKLLRHLNKRLADLSLESVSSRLATFLLKRSRMAGSMTFSLGMSKRDLAFKLGTIPETLSRNLKKLKDRGIVDVGGSEITIKNISMLEKLT